MVFIWRAIWQDFVRLSTLIPSDTASVLLSIYPRKVPSQMSRGPCGLSTALGFPGMGDQKMFIKMDRHHTYNPTLSRRKETGMKELTTSGNVAWKKKLRNRIDLEHNTLEVHLLKQKTIICFSLDTFIKNSFGKIHSKYTRHRERNEIGDQE